MSKIVKYQEYEEENIFLTADQSFAILKEKRLYNLDIRCSIEPDGASAMTIININIITINIII